MRDSLNLGKNKGNFFNAMQTDHQSSLLPASSVGGSCVARIERLPWVPLSTSNLAVTNALHDLGQQESSNREG